MSASLCYRFMLNDRAWEIDFATLTLNDWILLQEFSGRTRKQLLGGIEEEDAVALKVLWWAARRGAGEDLTLDSDAMNPQWMDFSFGRIDHLTPKAPEPEQAKWFASPQEPAEAP